MKDLMVRIMRNLFIAVLAFAVLAFSLFACGKGGTKQNMDRQNPVMPDVKEPGADYDDSLLLDVLRDTSGVPQGVRLTFDTSAQTGVSGYNVYKSTQSFTDISEAFKVNAAIIPHMPQQSLTYNDLFAASIGQEYFYRITVVDSDGDESPLSPERSIVITEHSITDVIPPIGAVGDTVTITGQFFGNYDTSTDKVYFWGINTGGTVASLRRPSVILETTFIEASVLSWTNTQIIVEIPPATINGPVKVSINGLDAQWNGPFQCTTPYLWAATPDPVIEGESITLLGGNFNTTQGQSAVFIGDIQATVLSWGNSSITASVPYGWGVKDVYVDVFGVGTTNHVSVVVEPTETPVITDITPQRAANGDDLRIVGNSFGSLIGMLDFNGLTLDETSADIVSWNPTEIVVKVPLASNTTGLIQVHSADAVPSNSVFFRKGANQEATFAPANFVAAGKMYGHGSAICASIDYFHFVTVSRNASTLHYFRKDITSGVIEEVEIAEISQYQGKIEGSAGAITDGGFLFITFAAEGHVYTIESDDDGFSWGVPVQISASLPAGSIGWLDTTATSNLGPAIAWGDTSTGAIYCYLWDQDAGSGGEWLLEEAFSTGYNGGEVQIALLNDRGDEYYDVSNCNLMTQNVLVRERDAISNAWDDFLVPITVGQYDYAMHKGTGNNLYVYYRDTALRVATANRTGGNWSVQTIAGTDTNGYTIDAIYDPNSNSSFIVTSILAPPHNPFLFIFNHDTGGANNWSISDTSNSEAGSPAIVLDKTEPFSIVGDTESHDLWFIDWLSQSTPIEENVTDNLGSFFLPHGSDLIASAENGGAGFLMVEKRRNPTAGFDLALYGGYYEGGVFEISNTIDTGIDGDFKTAGIEAIGNVFHVAWQKGTNLYYTTWDPGNRLIPPPTTISSFGTGVYDDIAILASHTNLLNVLFVNETTAGGPFTLKIATLPDETSTWAVEDVANLDIIPFGLDLTIDPFGEFVIPIFYDVVFGSLNFARYDGSTWNITSASLSALAGLNPDGEYHHGTGYHVLGFNSPQNRIEMVTGGPPWAQEIISADARYITPFSLYGGSNGGVWKLNSLFVDRPSNTLRFGEKLPGGSTTAYPVSAREPLWNIGFLSHAQDSSGGVTSIYSSEQDPGIYLLRFDSNSLTP